MTGILSKLSPAETLFVLLGKEADFSDLLKVTMMDLLRKEVIAFREVARQPSRSDKVRFYKYMIPGKNYDGYKPLPHEYIYIYPFMSDEPRSFLFRNYLKLAYDYINTSAVYRNIIMKNRLIKACFQQTIIQRWFGSFTLTAEGNRLKSELIYEFKTAENEISQNVANENNEKAISILKSMEGNIFLLKELDFDLFHQFDNELMIEIENSRHTIYNSIVDFKGFGD